MSELAPLMKTVRMPLITTFDDVPRYARAAARCVAEAMTKALDARNDATLAVPGGSVAHDVLPELARFDLPWDRFKITLVDERWVPPSHEASNEGLVRTLLPRNARFNVLFMEGRAPSAAADELGALIPAPDVVLLGMGDDGHIASLFPGDPVNFSTAKFAAVQRAGHPRITMTPPTLLAARDVILAFRGKPKATKFDEACTAGSAHELPVRHVLARAQTFMGP